MSVIGHKRLVCIDLYPLVLPSAVACCRCCCCCSTSLRLASCLCSWTVSDFRFLVLIARCVVLIISWKRVWMLGLFMAKSGFPFREEAGSLWRVRSIPKWKHCVTGVESCLMEVRFHYTSILTVDQFFWVSQWELHGGSLKLRRYQIVKKGMIRIHMQDQMSFARRNQRWWWICVRTRCVPKLDRSMKTERTRRGKKCSHNLRRHRQREERNKYCIIRATTVWWNYKDTPSANFEHYKGR